MAGTHGHGAKLVYGTSAAFLTSVASGTAVAEITSISGPDQSRDAIDVSSMDSSNKWREFIPAMIDSGEITMELNYGTAEANRLSTYQTNTATNQYWMVRFNDHTTEESKSQWSCIGYMTSLGYAIPFDDKITQSATFKFTGTPTYATS